MTVKTRAFTLIELLVVIAIIAVLVGLTATAVTGVLRSQTAAATNTTMQKLASEVDKQWKPVIDNSREEYTTGKSTQQVLAVAATDPDKAQKIWTRLRLAQEFPQTAAEATTGVSYTDPGPDKTLGTADDVTYTLPANPAYVRALQGAGPLFAGKPEESSACLYQILSVSRRGMVANFEEGLGPNVIVTVKGFKLFVDAWGKPITFQRLNKDNPPRYELRSGGPDKQIGNDDDLTATSLRQVGARGDK